MIVKALAKINLRLKTLGLNDNNYHLLQMVNIKTDVVYDELDISIGTDNKVEYSLDELNALEKDTCLNVLNDFCNIYNIKKRYHIYINKGIPLGAGLGGSSADAAKIINYLNEDNNLNLSLDELISFGIKYGSDIPYCLIDQPAIVEGIGEIVKPINYAFNDNVIIIVPDIRISTKEVYEKVSTESKKDNVIELEQMLINKEYKKLLINDLYKPACIIEPKLKDIYNELIQFGDVIMSGSGSSFILINPNEELVKKVKQLKNVKIYSKTAK